MTYKKIKSIRQKIRFLKNLFLGSVLISIFCLLIIPVLSFATPVIQGCQVLPANNIWNTPVDRLPVDPHSSAYISSIGTNSAFHPDFQFTHVPPTSPRTLIRLRKLAMNLGLKYVYVGNISDDEGNSTFCHNCSTLLIRRNGYQNEILELQDGKCKKCGIGIPGIFH